MGKEKMGKICVQRQPTRNVINVDSVSCMWVIVFTLVKNKSYIVQKDVIMKKQKEIWLEQK